VGGGGFEAADGLGDLVFDDGEVFTGEVGDEGAVFVGDDDIQDDDAGGELEGLRLLRVEGGGDEEENEGEEARHWCSVSGVAGLRSAVAFGDARLSDDETVAKMGHREVVSVGMTAGRGAEFQTGRIEEQR
jgi:hypothetical protein